LNVICLGISKQTYLKAKQKFKQIFLNQVYSFTEDTDSKLKSSPGVIIDIGANIGISIAYFRSKYPNTKLIAIEASPINYLQLKKNIEENNFQNVEAINCFLANKNGVTKFYHNVDKPGGSFGEGFKHKNSNKFEEFDVNTAKLSDLINSYKNIVIKIDVEGAEYQILKDLAASNIISQVIEITIEISTQIQKHYNDLNEVINDFYNLGFEPRVISDYTTNYLKNKSKQGHLQLILIR
jgi:FkbM family methyltransferase